MTRFGKEGSKKDGCTGKGNNGRVLKSEEAFCTEECAMKNQG